METRRLYYEDAYIKNFTATVTACAPAGDRWAVILDATAFYPEGGGQAADTGYLSGVRVLDVQEQEEKVLHFCDGPLTVGSQVEGTVDFEPRFDRMQQHTGEHILCGLVHKRFGWHNVGFHMGEQVVTVDFDGPIPVSALPELEWQVNEAIWQNIPVETLTPSPEELPNVFYRTKKALPWPVRIVRVPGYDSCACCGLHVKTTAEIGLMKIFSCVKFHEGVRLEIACGRKAMALLRAVFEQNRQVSQAFSAQMMETGEGARKVNAQLSAQKQEIAALKAQLRQRIAADYAGYEKAIHFEPALTSAEVRELADAMADHRAEFAAVFSGTEEGGYSYCIISRCRDLRVLGKEMNASLQGRGGGRPDCQQGSVKATKAEIEAFFAQYRS